MTEVSITTLGKTPGKTPSSLPDPALASKAGLDWLNSFVARQSSIDERRTKGKARRQSVPRSTLAEHRPRRTSAKALALIDEQNTRRYERLVPIRWARMLASPFGWMRGSPIVMADDLSKTPTSGIRVMACGDMHLMNFGMFASSERNLVFAINDFDEVHPGPWEWDLKRLAASAAVATVYLGGDLARAQQAAFNAASKYVSRMNQYANTGYLETWYDLIDENAILAIATPDQRRYARQVMDKARARGPVRALEKLTEKVDGEPRIVEDAPLIVREAQLPSGMPINEALDKMLRSYVASLPEDRRRLLGRYRIVDVARKVVGVGSVGTGWVVLFQGLDSNDPLLLQVKEAQPSILAKYVDTPITFPNQGQRVILGQRLIQGSPDIFLGWGPDSEDSGLKNFYVRQLSDMKGGIRLTPGDTERLATIEGYCGLCGWALALAHAKSGDPAEIAGYCGKSDAVPEAVSRYALAYLDQTLQDHDALAAAVRAGKVTVATPAEAGV
jgi:uncharacterized protein (DUF2252 family)